MWRSRRVTVLEEDSQPSGKDAGFQLCHKESARHAYFFHSFAHIFSCIYYLD